MRLSILLAATTAFSTVLGAPAKETEVEQKYNYKSVRPKDGKEACKIWGTWYAEDPRTREYLLLNSLTAMLTALLRFLDQPGSRAKMYPRDAVRRE